MYGAIAQIIHILQALGKPCKVLGFKKISTIHILDIKMFCCLQQRKPKYLDGLKEIEKIFFTREK